MNIEIIKKVVNWS